MALPYTGSNQLVNILCKTAEQASCTKHDIRKQSTAFPAKDITQLAIEGLERSQSQEVGSSNPTGQVQGVQIRANLSIAGDNNCLIGSRQEYLNKVKFSKMQSVRWK